MPRLPVYKNLEVYQLSKKLVVACYELTNDLRAEEAGNFIRYIRNAALNAHANIACAIFTANRKKKPLKVAMSSIIIIDAAVDILVELRLVTKEQVEAVTYLSESVFQAICPE